MGLINNDSYVASNGCEKSGTYISFNNEPIYIQRNKYITDTIQYVVTANYRIYWNKTARDANMQYIDSHSISVNIGETELNQSPYRILYSELTHKYPNSEDDINNTLDEDTNTVVNVTINNDTIETAVEVINVTTSDGTSETVLEAMNTTA